MASGVPSRQNHKDFKHLKERDSRYGSYPKAFEVLEVFVVQAIEAMPTSDVQLISESGLHPETGPFD